MSITRYDIKIIFYLIAAFGGLELASLASFFWPSLNSAIFIGVALAVVILSFYKLEYGLLAVAAELAVGSKGYLFYLPLGESGRLLSIRIVIWSLFMIIFFGHFLVQLFRDKQASVYWQRLKDFFFLKPFFFLATAGLIGLISALIYRNDPGNIFSDFNAWLYFLLLVPLISLDWSKRRLIQVFLAGTIWISLKTLILLGIFAHETFFALDIYRWLRRTLVGEMTAMGGWNRVFIQSQIFAAIAYFFFIFRLKDIRKFKELKWRDNLLTLGLLGLFFSALVISLSRSFWVAFAVTAVAVLIFVTWRYAWQQAARLAGLMLLSAGLGLIIILSVIPRSAPAQLEEQLAERVSGGDEVALVSRWLLLPEIISEIKRNPLTGQGYGATVTYISQDPRVLENDASGRHTTYAFEWGYLDIWLKIGLVGLAAYLWLLGQLLLVAFRIGQKSGEAFYFGLAAGLIFLAATHMFTPYLNHPLGIGFIIAASCLISRDRVY